MIAILLFIVFFVFYLYFTRNYDYWKERKVCYSQPIPLFGNHFRNIFGVKSIVQLSVELYQKYPEEKIVGYFRGITPELLIRDLDIAKAILNNDFAYFHPRGLGRDSKKEPLLANLFHTDGDKWILLRKRLTSAFTTAKLKGMFPLIVNCAKKLQGVGEKIVSNGGECDARELMARFTTEFIGAVGFGIEFDSINNENSQFLNLGKSAFKRPWKNFVLFSLWELFPELRKFITVMDDKLERAFTQIVNSVCEQRNYQPSGRNDFIDLLLEYKAKGTIKCDSIENRNPDGTPIPIEMEMDMKCIVAQVEMFFVGGFETSSSATSFTLHELAFNPEIQRKIQNEIDEVLLKYNNELCYDSIANMTMLSNAFKEAMRIFPSVGVLHRVCAKKYTIPELNITLDPGVKIMVPIQAIQTDEKYYDDPFEFRPERFENEIKRHQLSFFPFGVGPRACIGGRLGEMESLTGLAALLHKFTVEPVASSKRRLEVNPTLNIMQGVKGGIPLKLTLRKKK